MTPEAQRAAIEEACGWIATGSPKDGMFMTELGVFFGDPLLDLNAMHEAEKTLSKEEDSTIRARNQFNLYVWNIYDVCTGHAWESDINDYPGDVMCATAAQRAEAFLKTIGKWTDA